MYINADDFKSYKIKILDNEQIKIVVKGNIDILKSLKKTKKYKDLMKLNNLRLVFKNELCNNFIEEDTSVNLEEDTDVKFTSILKNIVLQKKDTYMLKAYEEIVNNNDLSVDDVFFL